MQVLDRVVVADNWITISFVLLLLLLFVLKLKNPSELHNFAKAFFLKGFIERKVEDKSRIFSFFSIGIFLFSTAVLAFSLGLLVKDYLPKYVFDFLFFLKLFSAIIGYFLIAAFADFLLARLFKIKEEVSYFIKSKTIYYYNISLYLFPICIFTNYSLHTNYLLLVSLGLLFLLTSILIVINNKNLIINKLFYFILYLCALKIVPLVIVYKILI